MYYLFLPLHFTTTCNEEAGWAKCQVILLSFIRGFIELIRISLVVALVLSIIVFLFVISVMTNQEFIYQSINILLDPSKETYKQNVSSKDPQVQTD